MGFKFQAGQISHTCQRCNLDVWVLVQSRRVGHRSLVTLGEDFEDLIFFIYFDFMAHIRMKRDANISIIFIVFYCFLSAHIHYIKTGNI